jgi:hypothetical protein
MYDHHQAFKILKCINYVTGLLVMMDPLKTVPSRLAQPFLRWPESVLNILEVIVVVITEWTARCSERDCQLMVYIVDTAVCTFVESTDFIIASICIR